MVSLRVDDETEPVHTGAMVALVPTEEDLERLAVEGGEPAGQLHVTLFYLGEGADFGAEARTNVIQRVRDAVGDLAVVDAEAFAISAFNPHREDADTAIALLVGGDGLADLHDAVTDAVRDDDGDLPEQHTPWCAHLTLAYSDDVTAVERWTDRCGPIRFDRVRVAFAGEHTDIFFTDPDAGGDSRAAFGGTFLPSRSEPMAGDERQIQYGRAFADRTERVLADEPAGTPLPFIASTAGVQRDGLDLRASGWALSRFAANPVFLWCHDQRSEPLGQVRAFTDVDRLRADVIFDQEDPRARRIESKYRRGFLSAVSVGWDFVDASGERLEWWRLSPEQIRDDAFYDLLELSAVPVPADPAALVMRQRTALTALGRELVSLFDEQENHNSEVTAPELRAAVRAELLRIGLDADGLAGQAPAELVELVAEPAKVTIDEPALARAIRAAFGDLTPATSTTDDGTAYTGDQPPVQPTTDTPARTAVVNQDAAQAVLAAFKSEGKPE